MANDLLIRLLLKDEASKKITTVEGQLVHLSNTAKQVYGAIAGSAAIAAIGIFMKQSVDAAMQEEDALNRVNAAMILQGTYSESLSFAYKGLAESLQRNSRFADDAIMNVMQTLVTLGNVAPASMQRVTQAVLDYSAATHKDLQASSEIVAKAAQGSVTAFSRLGVTFTENMTAAEKFERVLSFIEARMGGMAQKDIYTYAGATSQLANEWNNLQEEFGKFITQNPDVVNGIRFATRALEDMEKILKKIRETKEQKGSIFDFDLERLQLMANILGGMPTLMGAALGSKSLKAGAGFIDTVKSTNEPAIPESINSEQITNEQRLKAESDFWMAKAQLSIQGEEVINSIQKQYGNAARNMIAADKLFFVQNELERVNIIINSGQLEKTVAEQVHSKKAQLLAAEKKLKQDQLAADLANYQTTWSMMSQTVAMAVGENKKYAALMKALAIGEAIINTSIAYTKALAQGGFVFGIPMATAVAALGMAQVAMIAAQPMAEGGSGIVTRPTLFLAGEAGPERFSFTPINRINSQERSQGNTTVNNISIEINNPVIREDRDIDALAAEIDRRIARGTSR